MKEIGAALAALIGAAAACTAPPRDAAASGLAADAARAEQLYRQCYACHALEPDRNTPAGPTLHAVVGRPIAGEGGFNYSPALRRLAQRHGRWTPELLDRFIADPAAVAPGTEMGYPGLASADDRRILIAWLGR